MAPSACPWGRVEDLVRPAYAWHRLAEVSSSSPRCSCGSADVVTSPCCLG